MRSSQEIGRGEVCWLCEYVYLLFLSAAVLLRKGGILLVMNKKGNACLKIFLRNLGSIRRSIAKVLTG